MQPLEFVSLTCPHCGATFDTEVDISTLPASYVEDCQICCAPIVVTATMEGGDLSIHTRRENY
ncbi:MAG: CPXCG motif-containing cysteine-rich protein [Thioalkalivibrio sp.]